MADTKWGDWSRFMPKYSYSFTLWSFSPWCLVASGFLFKVLSAGFIIVNHSVLRCWRIGSETSWQLLELLCTVYFKNQSRTSIHPGKIRVQHPSVQVIKCKSMTQEKNPSTQSSKEKFDIVMDPWDPGEGTGGVWSDCFWWSRLAEYSLWCVNLSLVIMRMRRTCDGV